MSQNSQEPNLKQQTIKILKIKQPLEATKALFQLIEQHQYLTQYKYPHNNNSNNNNKYEIVHMSILGLLQMAHDWENLNRYQKQWRMTMKMGTDIVKRMRRRVGQDAQWQGNQQQTNQQLTRLFSKHWQFSSPKKQAPNYQLIRQSYRQNITRKYSKKQQNRQIIRQQIKERPQQKYIPQQSNIPKITQVPPTIINITTKSSQLNNKPRQSILSGNPGRSLKLTKITAFTNNTTNNNTTTKEQLPLLSSSQQIIKKQASKQIHQQDFINQQQQLQETPQKIIPKPILKITNNQFNQNKDNKKQSYVDNDFDTSAIKTKQLPYYKNSYSNYNSNNNSNNNQSNNIRSVMMNMNVRNKNQDFDFQYNHHSNHNNHNNHNNNNKYRSNITNINKNSQQFEDFSEDSKFIYQTNEKIKSVHNTNNNNHINKQDFDVLKQLSQQKDTHHIFSQQKDSNGSKNKNKKFFTFSAQKMALIQPHIQPPYHLRDIQRKNGTNPLAMLRKALQSL